MKIPVRNIEDAEAFVKACMHRSWLVKPRDQHEYDEVLQEGLTLLLELSSRFDEHRPGYDRPGSFSMYAAKYLPLRLENAWLRMHREHRVYRTSDGRQMIEFGERPESIESRLADREREGDNAPKSLREFHKATPQTLDCEPRELVATGWRPPARVHDAILTGLPSYLHDQARGVLSSFDDGFSVSETAMRLGIPRADVDEIRGSVATALVCLEGEPRWVASRPCPSLALTLEKAA